MRKKSISNQVRKSVKLLQRTSKNKSRKRVSKFTRQSEYSDPFVTMLRGGIRK